MTVSPQWPDEGKTPQLSEGNPDFTEPADPSRDLPPTNLAITRRHGGSFEMILRTSDAEFEAHVLG